MKLYRILFFASIFAVLIVSPLLAQNGINSSVPRTEFQAVVSSLLAQQERGEYLYHHSESYHRLINFRARKQLGLITGQNNVEKNSILNSDISKVIDPYDNSDDQDETSAAINQANPSLICIGSNYDGFSGGMFKFGMPVYTSTDKGISWHTHLLPMPRTTSFVSLGDPVLATDDKGNFYYAYLEGLDGSNDVGAIGVAVSRDGINWSNKTEINVNRTISGNPDKEHITVDCSPSSPHYGRVYVVWYEYYGSFDPREGLTIIWSDDGCKTWSNPVSLGAGDNFQEVKTNSKGDIFITFTNSQDLGQEIFASTDGGKTFTKNQIPVTNAFSNYPSNNDPSSETFRFPVLKGDTSFRSFTYISYDIDRSNNRIHVVYPNYEMTDAGVNASVLYYTTSDDNGKTFTEPKKLGLSNPEHSDPEFDHFHPWVSVDQKTGEAWAMYYSSENDPNNLLAAAYRVKLTGTLADYPEMLHQDFDPQIVETEWGAGVSPFIGDYNGSDAFDSVYVASWTENRPGNLDGEIFAYISSPQSGSSSVPKTIVIKGNVPWLSPIYPNPVTTGVFSLSYYLPHTSQITIELEDANGKIVQSLSEKFVESGSYTESFSVKNIASGTYLLHLRSADGDVTGKIIVE